MKETTPLQGSPGLVAGALVLATGAMVLVGWTFDLPALKSVLPGFVSMKANTAVGLVLAGLSLVLLGPGYRSNGARVVSLVSAGLASLLGLLNLGQYLAGIDLGIDQLLFQEPVGTVGTVAPGRMALTAALNFLMLGAAVILAGLRRSPRTVQVLALLAGSASGLALLGYLYEAPGEYGIGRYSLQALHTAVAFLVMSLGVIRASQAAERRGAAPQDLTAGDWVRRTLEPVVVGVPLALGWLLVQAEDAGYLEGPFGVALMVAVMMAVLTVWVGWAARTLDGLESARRAADERVRASEQRFRKFFDEGPTGMVLVGPDLRFRRANESFCRFVGYDEAELAGMTFLDITQADRREQDRRSMERLVAGEIPVFRTEKRYVRKDGRIVWGAASISILRADDGPDTTFLGTIEDISERKRIEAEKVAFEAVARQQQKLEAIGTLASGVAHEINNPLNVILNYGQLLQDSASDPAMVRDYAGHIVKESERVAVIVSNLLGFARQDKETHSPARIIDIVESTLSLTRSLFRKDQIAIECVFPGDLPSVKCRSQQIQQVVMNLLTNARDALNQRYPKADSDKRIRIVASSFVRDGIPYVRLTVEDLGAGIPPDVAERVFDPFFTTKPRDKGTGLGLSISYGIVKEHHGDLWFETRPGQGTSFHMDLRVNNGWSVEGPGASGSNSQRG